MNIKRTIAAILAFLALASFAGCKGEKRKVSATIASKNGISENYDEYDATAFDGQTNISDNTIAAGGTVQQTKDARSTKAVTSSTKSRYSRYFIGYRLYLDYSLDKWNHWNVVNEGYWNSNGNYFELGKKKYNSHGDLVKYTYYADPELDDDEDLVIDYKYIYNKDGTVKEFTDSSKYGLRYCYKYDAHQRPIRISAVDENNGDETFILNISYDKNGRIATADDGSCKATFTYDKNGNLIRKERVYAAGDLAIQTYKYNSRNDVVEVKDNMTSDYSFEYDKNGFLIKLVEYSSSSSMEVEYKNDKYGNPIEEKYTMKENGNVTSTYTYTASYIYNASSIEVTRKEGDRTVSIEYGYQINRPLRDVELYIG